MAALSLRDRMNFSNQYLEPALDAGLLEMTLAGFSQKSDPEISAYR